MPAHKLYCLNYLFIIYKIDSNYNFKKVQI